MLNMFKKRFSLKRFKNKNKLKKVDGDGEDVSKNVLRVVIVT